MVDLKWKFLRGLTATVAALACGAAIGVGAAMADDDDDDDKPVSYPYLKGEITIEVQSDHTYDADDPNAEISDTYNTTEAELEFRFSERFAIMAGLVFEPVLDAEDDRVFEDHGLYVEQLFAQYTGGPVNVFGGKFNVNFGKAWDLAPGVYGTDVAEDGYEFTERVGFGASVTAMSGGLGEVTVSASVFKADTSSLSNSAFTNRGQLDIDDGGFGNTETLENFNIAVDGKNLPGFPGLSYHFAYIHQAKGRVGDVNPLDFARLDDQNGFVFGLYGEREYNSVKFEWLAEYAFFDNYLIEGEEAAENVSFFTVGGKVTVSQWNFAASYTYRPFEFVDGEEFEDHLLALSAGYEIREGLTLDVGYKYQTDEEEDTHTIGVLLTKEFEFNTGK